MEALPTETIAEILSRLIVKDLLICKVGSKQRVVYSTYPNLLDITEFDSCEEKVPLEFPPLYSQNENAMVVGSCDGLICLCEDGRLNTRFALLNPTTRLFNTLPWTPFDGTFEPRYSYLLYYGFGYDSTIDDYKVLRIAQTSAVPRNYFHCDARVYSLSTNTWKKVADVPYCLFTLQTAGVFVNGALHFLASEIPEQPIPDKIVAFKLGDESYHLVPEPEIWHCPEHKEKRHWLSIGVLDGCLSQVDNYCSEDHHYVVWIMKEYGVAKSWSKLYTIPYPEPIPMFSLDEERELIPMFSLDVQTEAIPPGLRPISFSRNKMKLFFMVYCSHFVSYDLEKKAVDTVLRHTNKYLKWDMFLYEETLTSPFAGSNNGEDDEGFLELPQDILIDILLRLPVNSLIRFKSVSWSWYDIITAPRFASRQVEWSRKTSSKLHAVYNAESSVLRHSEFESFDGDTGLDHPLVNQRNTSIVVGVSNGILCLCDIWTYHLTFPFALYNPTTRSSFVLPIPYLDGFSMDYDHFYGFGYARIDDDYRVIKIAQLKNRNGPLQDFAQLYSLNTNSWKWVTPTPFLLSGSLFSGVCVNGVVHWVASTDSNRKLNDAIVGFDIVADIYNFVPQPKSLEPLHGRRCFLNIGVLDGCLSQVCSFLDDHFHDVWIMREHGFQNSWSKLFRIVDEDICPVILRPKFFSRDKKEVFFKGLTKFLVSYNVEDKKLRTCDRPDCINWDIHIYEETLVSTHPGVGDGNGDEDEDGHWEEQYYL